MNIILTREKARLISRSRHPWIFSGAIASVSGEAVHGAYARVVDEEGAVIGSGFYSAESKIACRIVGWGNDALAPGWVRERLAHALALRHHLRQPDGAFRLVNAEGDFFPGLIIDVYGPVAVVRPQVRGVELVLEEIVTALVELLPGTAVFLKRDERAARVERLERPSGWISGTYDGDLAITEDGVRFFVDVREGQKTGFYLDQRDNRALLKSLAAGGRTVLNLFSYTGAFALKALQGGSGRVDSVDTSQAALALAERNYGLNIFPQAHEARWIREDGFDFLARAQTYDIIVLDPPPFARTRGEVPGALRGYRRLQSDAFKRLSPGGLLFTFSCSGAVDVPTFRKTVYEASLDAGRPVRVMRELQAAPDHPSSLHHPEGEYLKGLLLHVR